MANATQLPDLFFGQWARPDAGKPTLAAPISADITDLDFVFSEPLLDEAGDVISKAVIIGITQKAGYTEAVYFAAGAFTANDGDGTSATATARGVDLSGLDYTTSNAGLAVAHDVGEKVFVQVSGVYEGILNAALRGASVSTGGVTFTLGAGADSTVTLQRNNGGSFLGFLRWNTDTDQVQYSNDGAVWISIDDSIASVLVKVRAADTTAGYLNDKIKVGGLITKTIVNPAGDEELLLEVDSVSVDMTYTFIEPCENRGMPFSVCGDDEVEQTVYRTLDNPSEETTFDSGASSNVISIGLDFNFFVNVYAVSSQLYAKGAESSEINNQRYGATATGAGANTGNSMSACKLSSNTFAVAYRASGSNEIYARIGSVNSTTRIVTFGSAVLVGTQNASAQGYTAIAASDSGTLVVVYRDTANSNIGTAKAATFSGTTLSAFGAGETMQEMSDIALAQIDEDTLAVFYRAADTFGYGELLTVSGTTISSGSPVQIDSNASTAFQASTIELGASGRILVTWVGGASGYIQARVCERDGITIDFPTAATAVNALVALTPCGAVCNTTTGYIVYEESASSDGKLNEVAISGTTLTVGTQYSFNSTDNVSSTSACAVTANNKFLVAFRDEADSNKGNAIVFQNKDNRKACVGVAIASYDAGDEGTVRSKGIVQYDSASLVAGDAMYLGTTDFLVTNESETALKVGVARNTEQIDVDIEYSDVYSLVGEDKGELIAGTSTGVSTVAAGNNSQLLAVDTDEATGLTFINPSFTGVGAMNKNYKVHNMDLMACLIANSSVETGTMNIEYVGMYLTVTAPTNGTRTWSDIIAPMNATGATNGLSWNSTQIKTISCDFTVIFAAVSSTTRVQWVGFGATASIMWNSTACYFRWNAVDTVIPTPAINTPYYCRFEFDGDTDTINLYVDGTLAATVTAANAGRIDFELRQQNSPGTIPINLIGGAIQVEYN